MNEGRGWKAERGAFPTATPSQSVVQIRRALEQPATPAPPAVEAQKGDDPTDLDAKTVVDNDSRAARSSLEPAVVEEAKHRDAPTVADILRESEVGRTVVFYRAMLVVSVLVLAAIPVLPGVAWLRVQTAAACFFAAIICLAALVIGKDRSRYTPRVAATFAIALTALAVVVIYFLGLYSASATLLSVGIYFYGSSESRWVARTAYGTAAILYFLVTLAIAVDFVPDLAVFSVNHVAKPSRFYRVFMQQAIFGMTFYLARNVRRATQAALERARENDLVLRQREAQLIEAQLELERALRAGDGRLSGKMLDRFRLGEVLGRGGMGEVYAAIDTASNDPVAVKVLHPNMLEDASNVQRFMREAQAVGAVPSEHVPKLFEVGMQNGGVPYIVMELLEGHDLAFYLRRSPQLPLEQVVEMVEHTARALSAVRDAGIVHRDLKPGNLFLTDTLPRRWKVLDFGLSKLQGTEAITKDQAVGTPSYMAPEQIRGGDVNHLADLYALTAIAYRAITGRAPFLGDEVAQVLMDVIRKVPESPSDFARVPVDVELVLAIGLAKRRADRFQGVEELARALRLASQGGLDDVTRVKGWSLLKNAPWGSTIRKRL